MNITQTKLGTKLSCVYKYNVFKVTVCPQLWTYPYMISRQLGWDVHNFGQKSPYVSISLQLGWDVHYFGQKNPYINISRQLGWGVHHFGQKSPCANIIYYAS